MSKDEIEIIPPHELAIASHIDRVREFTQDAYATNSKRAYAQAWQRFDSWCEAEGFSSLPATPETVAMFLTSLAEGGKQRITKRRKPNYSIATIRLYQSVISVRHDMARCPNPCRDILVKQAFKGVHRRVGEPQQRAKPLTVKLLEALIDHLPETLAGIRDRALLLVGFSGAFRRSELVSLYREHLDWEDTETLKITLPRSKTDQYGEGAEIFLSKRERLCPLHALQAWFDASGITDGPIFRSVSGNHVGSTALTSESVQGIIQSAAKEAGFHDWERYTGHSLRAGFATEAANAKWSLKEIMEGTRHDSAEALLVYIRQTSSKEKNGSKLLP